MTQQQFHDAIKNAMGKTRFELMVLFSCLTNMVEIGYSLRDVTRYLVASEDEIRLVNNPPGTFQIRGIRFETLLDRLRNEPNLPAKEWGKIVVDTFLEQYTKDIHVPGNDKGFVLKRLAAGLSLIDCNYYDAVAERLDALALHLQSKMKDPSDSKPILQSFRLTLKVSQRYSSFLNLEYYDLQDFLEHLQKEIQDSATKKYCTGAIDEISQKLIVYERHTGNNRSNGVSVYLSHFLIPENIFQTHQKMYRACLFSQKTAWDEMIDLYRMKMVGMPSERKPEMIKRNISSMKSE